MKKTIFKTSLILCLVFLFSSCAAGLTGNMNNSAALSSDNFTYVKKNLKGKSQATYVLGIGGMNREAIVDEAKQNLLENYSLEDGQALANSTVNFKYSSFLGIVTTYKCYVTGDIVQFQ